MQEGHTIHFAFLFSQVYSDVTAAAWNQRMANLEVLKCQAKVSARDWVRFVLTAENVL